MRAAERWTTPEAVRDAFDRVGYLADQGLATAIFLSVKMARPLFLEGEPGVGKTAVAGALAASTGARLVRLQCHEGIDVSQALYEWDHARQLLHIRAREAARAFTAEVAPLDAATLDAEVWTEAFLIRRPILDALSATAAAPVVLLIDEIDRADDEFEAALLEVLAEAAVTIPELGTVRADETPLVVLTSNRTRDVHDAVKRRCIYHWLDHPEVDRELAIIRRRAPEVADALAHQVAVLASRMRQLGLMKPPGVAEAIDWALALQALGGADAEGALSDSLGSVLKYREDIERIRQSGVLSGTATP